ncbi:MAG TPA: ATP phosphoribosyltransferase [Elusimicrobiales bacterium]|nr:ATP phosphoribosyltransferase [Elusimicrobiales bacterium]
MNKPAARIRMALPKGRMKENIFELMADAGIKIRTSQRDYRPSSSLEHLEIKILKPQNIAEMLHFGSVDLGFTGDDWVRELDFDVVEVLDTGFDKVDLVAAAPVSLLKNGRLPRRKLVIASEYERLSKAWIRKKKLDAVFVRSYGATEVFPPEDADMIIDITATGSTLKANNLAIVDTISSSSTRLYASRPAYRNPEKRQAIDELAMLFRSVFEARKRVMLEVNVPPDKFDSVRKILPCMREPTVAELYGGAGYALKVAVPRDQLPVLIPRIKRHGGTDIIVTRLAHIVP